MERSARKRCPICGNDGLIAIFQGAAAEPLHLLCAGSLGCHATWTTEIGEAPLTPPAEDDDRPHRTPRRRRRLAA